MLEVFEDIQNTIDEFFDYVDEVFKDYKKKGE